MDEAIDCPACGLVNPPSAQRCDCGYDFAARQVLSTYLTEKDLARDEEHAAARAAPTPLAWWFLRRFRWWW